MAQKGSKKKVKKAAPKRAKARARKPVKRAPVKAKSRTKTARNAKTKAAPKPVRKALPKKSRPVKARKAAKPVKKAQARRAAPRASATKLRTPAPKTPAKTLAKVAKTAPVPNVPAPVAKARPAAKPKAMAPARRMAVSTPPTLQRERRRLPEAEDEAFTDVSEDSRLMSAARAGHDELRSELKQHTESSPAMTAGDVDAKWQDAYALGDEAPGGDNMTPDQDRVDDIGKALGIEYADDEELLGGEELVERDEHRWELDPASKEEDEDL